MDISIDTDRLDEKFSSRSSFECKQPKPDTRWDVLSGPLESTAQKTGRYFGYGFIGVGAAVVIGKAVLDLQLISIPKNIKIRNLPPGSSLGWAAAGSVVMGLALWFFNFQREDKDKLLKDRAQIGKEIETASLPDLRAKYPSLFALSDAELNAWIRHLTEKDPFDIFLQKHSVRIFGLNLDAETKNLLKAKYQEYLRHPDNAVSFLSLRQQKAFQVLLSEEEKQTLQHFVACRETDKLTHVDTNTYAEFISKQGVEILHYLDEKRLQHLSRGFMAHAYQSNIGILQLKKEHANELQRFGTFSTTTLMRNIADREAVGTYKDFKARNGAEAVDLITQPALKHRLSESFVPYVVAQNLGLVETRKRFAQEIQRFGADIAQKVDREVFNNKAHQLGKTLTYLQFREQNGINEIEQICYGNMEWTQFFREHFLKLLYKDLINPAYQRDRNLLNITGQDIQNTVLNRWNSMSLKDVLATDQEGFIASLQGPTPFFFPRTWTAKAVTETQYLSVYEIVKTYKDLFRAGVLTAADGNLWHRLLGEIAPITEWTDLLDKYGTFIFEYQLLNALGAARLAHRFVESHAENFVNEDFNKDFFNRYISPLQTFSLVNPSLVTKLTLLRDRRSFITSTFNEWKNRKDQECKDYIQQTQKDAEQRIAYAERLADLPKKQREKTEADADWKAKKAAYDRVTEVLDQDEKAIPRMTERLDNIQYKLLPPFNQEHAALSNQNPQDNYNLAKAAADAAFHQLKDAEATIANDEELKNLNTKLEARSKEYQELQQKIEKIEAWTKEQESLKEMPNQEARLAELNKLLAQEDHQLTPLKTHKSRLEMLLGVQQTTRNERFNTLAESVQLEYKRNYAAHTSQIAEHWKASLDKLESTTQDIERLTREWQKLSAEVSSKRAANEERKLQLRELQPSCNIAQERKVRAESAYSTASQELARQTTEVRLTCQHRIEEIQRQNKAAIAEKEAQKNQDLSSLVSDLKWHIRTIS